MMVNTKSRPSPPKYLRLARTLADGIKRGRWEPGEQLPSERALAGRYDMSHMTVNKAVASLVSRGLLVRSGRATYVAESPSFTLRDRAVGLYIETAAVGLRLLQGDLPAALNHADRLAVTVDLTQPKTAARQLARMLEDGIPVLVADGFSYFPFAGLEGAEVLPKLIFVHRYEWPIRFPGSYVLFDYREAGREAVRRMLAAGRSRLGLVGFQRHPRWTSQLFYEGCVEMLEEAGLTLVGEWLVDDETHPEMVEALSAGRLDGVVSVNDHRLVPVTATAARLGIRIPDDLALLGLGDSVEARLCELTTISIQPEVMTAEAVALLDAEAPRDITIAPRVIVRRSCPGEANGTADTTYLEQDRESRTC